MLTELNMNNKSDFQLHPFLPVFHGRYILRTELISTYSVFFNQKYLAVFVGETA